MNEPLNPLTDKCPLTTNQRFLVTTTKSDLEDVVNLLGLTLCCTVESCDFILKAANDKLSYCQKKIEVAVKDKTFSG